MWTIVYNEYIFAMFTFNGLYTLGLLNLYRRGDNLLNILNSQSHERFLVIVMFLSIYLLFLSTVGTYKKNGPSTYVLPISPEKSYIDSLLLCVNFNFHRVSTRHTRIGCDGASLRFR